MIQFKNAQIILEDKIITGFSLIINEDRIVDLIADDQAEKLRDTRIVDCEGQYLSPGFIDLHVHGGGNADFMDDDPNKFSQIAVAHARHGMTACLATTLASRNDEVIKLLKNLPNENDDLNGARILGVHLEGPYFAMEQRGAQDPKYIRLPDVQEANEILSHSNRIYRWSIAPELAGVDQLASLLNSKGILLSLAHTNANASQVLAAEKLGFKLATHLYSGMSTISKVNGLRAAGAVEGVFLSKGMVAEMIVDGRHLPLELVQLVYRILGSDRITFTTDAMRAAGTTLTKSILGSLAHGQAVIIKDGVAKLPDESSLAGSVATMDRLLRVALEANIPLTDAVKAMTINPAKLIHRFPEYGSLEKQAKADIVVFNKQAKILQTWVNGKRVHFEKETQ